MSFKERKAETLKFLDEFGYEQIDEEIRPLIKLMNKIKGIYTVESCVGNNTSPCRIWFYVDKFETLHKFCFYCLNCTSRSWKVCYDTGDIHRSNHKLFYLESCKKDIDTIKVLIYNLCQSIERELLNLNK